MKLTIVRFGLETQNYGSACELMAEMMLSAGHEFDEVAETIVPEMRKPIDSLYWWGEYVRAWQMKTHWKSITQRGKKMKASEVQVFEFSKEELDLMLRQAIVAAIRERHGIKVTQASGV